jgi:hypothetical protein
MKEKISMSLLEDYRELNTSKYQRHTVVFVWVAAAAALVVGIVASMCRPRRRQWNLAV